MLPETGLAAASPCMSFWITNKDTISVLKINPLIRVQPCFMNESRDAGRDQCKFNNGNLVGIYRSRLKDHDLPVSLPTCARGRRGLFPCRFGITAGCDLFQFSVDA